ncbi:MAG: c-type cytochrome, partial [Cyclobacteriaceae bacterium]|nr:c-type cytochrome [Cyclobacteriaceae bacterium]
GDLSDSSGFTPPQEALAGFRFPADLALDLVLSEPQVHQPVEVNFDHRGRLWVVQYMQYPYPEGLKVTGIDHHIRMTFDTVPSPPPMGVKGADKITVFEDTNQDGFFDKATDVITGLNIATSVELGRGQIWVLNPPYLLAYPDSDGDGLPDGSPEVHLRGFGLEDTHAVANSLRWGPDGWLYGAQGSTTTATVSSAVSKNVQFMGQAIWRYHPETKVFEVYAEGGGNTFHVEIDSKGRVYSGDNGTDRGMYYKQGAYYAKNWGKHGALTNPYAFGHLPNMALEGEKIRFTHAFVRYEGGSLPEKYKDKMVAINPLHNFLQLTRFEANGSSFANIDEERILETDDHWFRPVDIKVGPDGGIYLADWYDNRLSHVDPRDTWKKNTGRIYRLRNKDTSPVGAFDLSEYSNEQLTALLEHENKWFRQQALRQFGDRKEINAIPALKKLFKEGDGQAALEALWAIHLSGGLDDILALKALGHKDPFVRMWAVRLTGDKGQATESIAKRLVNMATSEEHPEVIGQLASSAKRWPGEVAVPIISRLLVNEKVYTDPDNPLLVWWALESKAISNRQQVLTMFEAYYLWEKPLMKEIILKRLVQRYIMSGGDADYEAVTRLLKLAPTEEHVKILMTGIQEGLRGRDFIEMPVHLQQAIATHQALLGEGQWAVGLRQGNEVASKAALNILADEKADHNERLSYVRIMGEVELAGAVPVLLKLAGDHQASGALRQAALQSLQRYDDTSIGEKVAGLYPDRLRADSDLRLAALSLFASRPSWGVKLIEKIEVSKQINKADVPEEIVRQLKLLGDGEINEATEKLWPEVRLATSEEKDMEIRKTGQILASGTGNPASGKALFANVCGACHRLFDDGGGTLGPDLTGYDRKNINYLLFNTIDPNAGIREGYVYYTIRTADGRTLSGMITGRTGGNIVLKPLAGDEITLPPSQVLEMNAQPVSVMPERLLHGLSDQELRDLFSYLMKS